MRLLILTQYFAPEIGAPQARLVAIARELIRRGHGVEVVTALPNYPGGQILAAYRRTVYRFEFWEGIPVHRVWLYASTGAGFKRLLNYFSFSFMSLWGLMRCQRPDYIFVECPPLSLSIPGFIASRLWGVPFIFNVADLWPDSARELGLLRDGFMLRAAEALERWTYRNAAYINAVTEGIWAKLLAKGVPAAKLLFLPNGMDTDLITPASPDRVLSNRLGLEGKKIVLYAGNHSYAFALEHVLQAARLLMEEAHIHFLFVGDGSEKGRLIKLAQGLSLRNVTFLDPVPFEKISRLLSTAHCGVVTLRNIALCEGARPTKAFAVMAAAKPVVFAGKGECARLIQEAKAGIVVPPENAQALADAVHRLVRNPALAEELGRNGRRYVEEKLRWSRLIGSWLKDMNLAESSANQAHCLKSVSSRSAERMI
jgi:putative colanic acid biosynthesis glycosyltransferase WcaI